MWNFPSATVDPARCLLATMTLRLPVEIGRFGADNVGRISAGDGRVVHFGEGFGTLSRQHLTITQGPDGGLVVTDTSSNGISQVGQAGSPPVPLGRGGTVRMSPGAMRAFETVGLSVTVCAPKAAQVDAIGQPLHLVYDSSSTGGLKALDLDGVSIALVANGAEVLMRRRKGAAMAALEAARAEGAQCLVMIGPDGAGGITAICGIGDEVAHNRRMMAADEVAPDGPPRYGGNPRPVAAYHVGGGGQGTELHQHRMPPVKPLSAGGKLPLLRPASGRRHVLLGAFLSD